MKTSLFACTAVVGSIFIPAGAIAAPAPASSAAAGSFALEQSIRGRSLYGEHCASCHGERLEGVVTYAVNGKQYIGAASGKGSYWIGGKGAPTIIVFTLPDGA